MRHRLRSPAAGYGLRFEEPPAFDDRLRFEMSAGLCLFFVFARRVSISMRRRLRAPAAGSGLRFEEHPAFDGRLRFTMFAGLYIFFVFAQILK